MTAIARNRLTDTVLPSILERNYMKKDTRSSNLFPRGIK